MTSTPHPAATTATDIRLLDLGGSAATGHFTPPAIDELAAVMKQFTIEALIGTGGMGAVYRVRRVADGLLGALKVLPRELAAKPGFQERFARESKALAGLSHPHLVAIHDAGQTGGWCWLLMELVDGANLREVMRMGRLSPSQALSLAPQLCDALQYAHDHGVVHRDIKPENILLDQQAHLKLTDFGLAKLLDQPDQGTALTQTGAVLGTLHYMAPEQVELSSAVDHRADIYAVGVVLYEMLTGGLPLGRFQPPSHQVAVDVRIDEVVLKALEKDPERRYQHASDVRRDVEQAAKPLEGRAEAPAASTSPTTEPPGTPVVLLMTFLALASWRVHWVVGGAVTMAVAWWWYRRVILKLPGLNQEQARPVKVVVLVVLIVVALIILSIPTFFARSMSSGNVIEAPVP